MKRLLLYFLIIGVALLSGCATISPTSQESSQISKKTPLEMITLMTYNIQDGGGVGPTDPNGPWCAGPPPKG